MLKKILKYTVITILSIIGLVFLLILAAYTPPVQRFIKNKAVSYLSGTLDMNVSVDRLRIRFPLTLELDNALLTKPDGDTVVNCASLRAGIGLLPLIRGEVKARDLTLISGMVHIADTVTGSDFRVVANRLGLESIYYRFRRSSVEAASAVIDTATVFVRTQSVERMDTTSADTAAVAWIFNIGDIELNSVAFDLDNNDSGTVGVRVRSGGIEGFGIDLSTSHVRARSASLDSATVTLYLPPTENTSADDDQENEWIIEIDRIELDKTEFRMRDGTESVNSLFNPGNIEARDITARLDSFIYGGDRIRGDIRRLSFTERSGFILSDLTGSVDADSSHINLGNIDITTPYSRLALTGEIDAPLSGITAGSDLSARLTARIGTRDIDYFTAPPPQMSRIIGGRQLLLDGNFSGTLSRLEISTLGVRLPDNLTLRVSGTVGSITDPDNLTARVRMDGTLDHADFLRSFIADTAFRARVAVPDHIALNGTIAIAGRTFRPDLTVTVDTGRLEVAGQVNTSGGAFDARVLAADFPVAEFLPYDSLGIATFDLSAASDSFDFLSGSTTASLALDVSRFDYRGYSYGNILLAGALQGSGFYADIYADDIPLNLEMEVSGSVGPGRIEADIDGIVRNVDLYQLGITPTPLGFSSFIVGNGYYVRDSMMYAYVDIDTMRLRYSDHNVYADRTTAEVRSDPDSVTAAVTSGDFFLNFLTPVPLGELTGGIDRFSTELGNEIDSLDLRMTELASALPPFTLRSEAGPDNILHEVLRNRNLDFRRANVRISNSDTSSLRGSVVAEGFTSGSLRLDTLNLGFRTREDSLKYFIRLANRPGNIDLLSLLWVHGYAARNTAQVNLYQRDRTDSVGFRFGINATAYDSLVRFGIFPENPVLGYTPWTVNSDNYIDYYYSNLIEADLRMTGRKDNRIMIRSTEGPNSGRELDIDMAGINIGTAVRMFPSPPPISGMLSTDIRASYVNDVADVDGTIDIRDFSYDRRRVGNVTANLNFRRDTSAMELTDTYISLDSTVALRVNGRYTGDPDDETSVNLEIPGLPLAPLGAFLPRDAANLTGSITGSVDMRGTLSAPVLNGELAFRGATVEVIPVNTVYGLSATPIPIRNSVLSFDRWSITSPGNVPLTLDGEAELESFSRIYLDADVYATNFDAVNSARGASDGMITGKALVDIDVSAYGYLDALAVSGDIGILNGTDITYTTPDRPAGIQDQTQDLVTFVDFRDTVNVVIPDSILLASSGSDIFVTIEIEDGVQATMNLTSDGNTRVEVTGEGTLTYAVNSQGDSRFTGRYNLSGGTVVYSPPVISAKTFAINEDSYVEWSGDIADPYLNITATETLRTIVEMDDNTTSNVTFQITIELQNTLEELDLQFDLAAPDNLTIQNQLQSLAPEQRSQQAIALLVYNTYTGPGTSAKVDVNNPLNAFISREINSWARNSLPGVDLSFGINSVDDSATGGGQHTDYSYKVSKTLFDDRIKVSIGGSLNSDADAGQNLQDNFVDDIAVEYRLSRNDNMYLKFYRFNTQENILDGEIAETGVGYGVRKKVDKLKELFKFRRSPQKKEAARNRREIKQRIRRQEKASGEDPAREQRQDDPLGRDENDINDRNRQDSRNENSN